MKKIPLKPNISPSVQLKEANKKAKEKGGNRIGYLPHIGAKQRAKQLAKQEKIRCRLKN